MVSVLDRKLLREVRSSVALLLAITSIIAVGDMVESVYGVRRVVKINTKSLRIEGALGAITIDKSLCRKVLG